MKKMWKPLSLQEKIIGFLDFDRESRYTFGGGYFTYDRQNKPQIADVDVAKLVNDCNEKIGATRIDAYCIDRIFYCNTDIIKHTGFTTEYTSGYYNEIQPHSNLTYDTKQTLISQITTIIELPSVREKVFYVLDLEYGYLADIIKDAKTFEVVNVNKNEIVLPNQTYSRRLDKKAIEKYADRELPIGIYLQDGDSYRVCDGYHRSTAFLKSSRKNAPILVAKF